MHKRNIVLLCLITFLQGMVFYAAVATLYRQAAGLSIFEITAIEGISVAMALALEVPWGRIAERIGYRHTMVVCNLLFLLTKLIFWQAESFSAFLLERLLLAVVISGLSGVDAAMLFMSAPKEQAQRNGGWYRAAGEAGVLSAGLLYTVFLSGHYRAAAFWTVITYALAALLTFFLSEVKSEEQRETRRFRALAKAHFSTPGILKLAVCAALFSESVHCITIYFSQLQYLRCGMNEQMIGAAFIIVSAAGLFGPLSAHLPRRSGLWLLLSAVICAGLLALTDIAILSVVLIVLLSGLCALFMPLAGALENTLIITSDRATALSLNAMIGDSLIVLLDLGLGRAADASLPLALALCALCCLFATGLFSGVPLQESATAAK